LDDTQVIQWTIIGSAVAIILVAIGLGSLGVWVIKAAMNSVEFELKADIAEVRAELKADIAEVKAELKADIAEVKLDIQANRNEITTNRRLL
jgi:phage host-nuclease inhibitor protein Gam